MKEIYDPGKTIMLCEVSSIIPGEVILFQYGPDREVFADAVTGMSLLWNENQWKVDHYWTRLLPESGNAFERYIRERDILESVITAKLPVQNWLIPARPPILPGDKIVWMEGSSEEEGKVRKVELFVDDGKGWLLFYILGQREDVEGVSPSQVVAINGREVERGRDCVELRQE